MSARFVRHDGKQPARRWWRARVCGLALLAGLGGAAAPAGAQPAFEEVLAGARREGRIEIWMASPTHGEVHRALFEAFERRFAVKIDWKWVTIHPIRSIGRLAAEAAVDRVSADVVGATSADNLLHLLERKLVRPYPWAETFGTALPAIREPADRLLPELRGVGLAWIDAVYVIAWNTRFVSAADAPRRFADLLAPRWRGRFAINVLGGAPFDLLSLEIGEAQTLALVDGLLANRPVLKPGTPATSGAITTGEAWLGISSFLNVARAKRAGEPQEFRFAEDFVPVMPLHVFVPAAAPHPSAARLFAAWLVTEGARIVERMDASARISDPGSVLATALGTRPPGSRIVQERSLADIRTTRAITAKIQTLYTGRR